MKRDVCAAEELQPGAMVRGARSTSADRRRAARADGELHGLLDRCLHQGGPLSGGRLQRATDGERPGEYRESGTTSLKCPWHGYEFDVRSGCALFDRRRRLRRVDVREEDGLILVE